MTGLTSDNLGLSLRISQILSKKDVNNTSPSKIVEILDLLGGFGDILSNLLLNPLKQFLTGEIIATID